MDPATPAPDAEAELQRFREQWRAEVARNKQPEASSSKDASKAQTRQETVPLPTGPSAAARRKDIQDLSEEIEPRAYHDLPDKEELLKLGVEGQDHDRNPYKEPSTALEHYERAVERETQGNLGDSMRHYRRAFKLDDGVHEAYKKKHFPPSSFVKPKPVNTNPSNAAVTVPGTGHHSLHGSTGLPSSLRQLVDEFSGLRIEPAPPATDASPQERSPLAELPEEILTQILTSLAVTDVASFARLALVCKRLAYLVLTEESVWKRVALGQENGFAAMLYDFTCDVEGFSLEANDSIARYLAIESDHNSEDEDSVVLPPAPEERKAAFATLTEQLLHTTYASSWRQMFRLRPRLRFNGCYISTVNYTRAGATSTNTLTWGAPVHVITYFRYLRFFRDGTCISLLTTSEPADVVHHLTKENLHSNHHSGSMLPSAVMKDALRGRWRLTGPASSVLDPVTGEPETEGDVHIETEGAVPKYTYKLILTLAHAGKGARNNKLAWKWFGSWNRLTDDWGEFGLKNDRAFYWSRVKSYGVGL
ncbi:uncharacterized protein LTR77_002937 [Saxophila tyrrhenica]|uniref:F-box domain-containing protein n=1 Tax=Saxophila tyrrhenica TaxID=1690608 RepID=A0AAV9PJ46_9PEZI|nr:hypothetical protein LTR77_002937 [Saxophila tyrrhenica]